MPMPPPGPPGMVPPPPAPPGSNQQRAPPPPGMPPPPMGMPPRAPYGPPMGKHCGISSNLKNLFSFKTLVCWGNDSKKTKLCSKIDLMICSFDTYSCCHDYIDKLAAMGGPAGLS